MLSVGRFHALPAASLATPGLYVHRRHSGGRCIPFGQGFIGLSILLPHRSALVSDDPLTLTPSQVLNRCVRGILRGLKSIGLPAFYPGRDWITIDRRIVGMISIDVSGDGGLLFEAILAASRNFGALATVSSGWPAEWTARMPRLEADAVTSLKRELGVELALPEIAEVLVRAYAELFEVSFVERRSAPGHLTNTIHQLATSQFEPRSWVADRRVQPHLDHHSLTLAPLGVFETYYSVGTGGDLSEIMLSGDIIANPAAIEAMEHRLRGCPADYASIDAIVTQIFAQPENFILGLPSTTSIAATICAGLTDGSRVRL